MSRAQALQYDFNNIPAEDRNDIAGIAAMFGLAGLLARKGRIDLDLFLSAYGNSVSVNYDRLKPYEEWRAGRHGITETLWSEFKYLHTQLESKRAALAVKRT